MDRNCYCVCTSVAVDGQGGRGGGMLSGSGLHLLVHWE